MKELIEQIVNSGLYPTTKEWWELVEKARQLLKD